MADISQRASRPGKPALTPGRIARLERERARLEEDVRQLRAAVAVWADIYLQAAAAARGRIRFEREVR